MALRNEVAWLRTEPYHRLVACLPAKNPTFPISRGVLKFFLMFILTRLIASVNFYERKVQQNCFGRRLMGFGKPVQRCAAGACSIQEKETSQRFSW